MRYRNSTQLTTDVRHGTLKKAKKHGGRIGSAAPEESGENEERTKLVLVGCISLILLQAMIHIGVNIRLFPTTGMTLPFISYGGSSIISISILSGIILNLTKRKIN